MTNRFDFLRAAFGRPRSRILPAVALLALVPATASAWEHTKKLWLPEDMPIPYEVADDGVDGVPLNSIEACEASGGMSGCCEETVPAGYCTDVTADSFDAWHDANCAEFEVFYDGISPNVGYALDYHNRFTFNDPDNQIAELGTWAVTLTWPGTSGPIILGEQYTRIQDADIVFNDQATFVTHEDAIGCSGPFGPGANMQAVMTHEIGHWFGMDHSCEDPNKGGAPCTDPRLREAIMYYAVGACSTDITISPDDIEGFNAIYGPFATFECSHQVTEDQAIGIVPFELNCVIISDYLQEVTSAVWNFGDGGTSTDLNPSHRYEEPGNYTVQVTVTGEREACGEDGWTNQYNKVGYVRACGLPDAAFEVVHVDGLKYQMLNESDVSVYGCISDIQWEVYKGGSPGGQMVGDPVKAWEPIIEFPEEGEYTVVMNLGGIGGTGAAVVTFDVKDHRGENVTGCSTAAAGTAGGGLLLLVGALAIRRRR